MPTLQVLAKFHVLVRFPMLQELAKFHVLVRFLSLQIIKLNFSGKSDERVELGEHLERGKSDEDVELEFDDLDIERDD